MKQRVCLSYTLKLLPQPAAVFTSNVQFIHLAAGLRTLKLCCYRSRLFQLFLRQWLFTR